MRRNRLGCLLPALLLLGPARAAISLDAARIRPGPGCETAQATADGALRLVLPFADGAERAYWDFPLKGLPEEALTLEVEVTLPDPAVVRSVSLHLERNNAWMSVERVPSATKRQRLVFARADFMSEGDGPEFWHDARRLRLSFWRGANRTSEVIVRALYPERPPVLVIRGTERTAPGETAFARRCARRAQALCAQAGLGSTVVSDELTELDLRGIRLLVLPYNPGLGRADLSVLRNFVAQDGGRLAVFYHAGGDLAEWLGFRVLPYVSQERQDWTGLACDGEILADLPALVPHRTRHLLPVRAVYPDARTTGYWLTEYGFPDREMPAAAVSPRGLWFSHVPPLAGPSATQWFVVSLAAADVRFQPRAEEYLAKQRRRAQEATTLALPAADLHEIRAVWTPPLTPLARVRSYRALAETGVNTVFERLASAGYALDRLGNAGRRPPVDGETQERIRRAGKQAREAGLRLHAWMTCWSLDGVPAAEIESLRRAGRVMRNAAGESLDWLCPSHPDNREHLLAALRGLAQTGIDGIHLDYVRYPGTTGCYADATRAAFERYRGDRVEDWPGAVLEGGALTDAFRAFREAEMSAFVQAAADALARDGSEITLSAAVFPYPYNNEHGQRWDRWLREDWLQFAAPMIYERDRVRFANRLEQSLAVAPAPERILAGIGTSADESQLDVLDTARQIQAVRERQGGGVAFFQFDSDLLTEILPRLRLANRAGKEEDPGRSGRLRQE